MLVLNREELQKVFFHLPNGDKITLDVVEMRRTGRVRLGITAPSYVRIERDDMKCGAKPSQHHLRTPEGD